MLTIIPEGHWALRESWGKFQGVINPGLSFWIPGFYSFKSVSGWGKIANKNGFLIEKNEQQIPTPLRHCQTQDHMSLNANASIRWKIIDPKLAAYGVDNLPQAISNVAVATLREQMAKMTFDEVFSDRSVLCKEVSKELSLITSDWGVEVLQFELLELLYSKEMEKALMQSIEAQRESEAILSLAKAESEATYLKAKAKAESQKLLSEAEAQAEVFRAQAQAKRLEIQGEADKKYLNSLKTEIYTDQAAELLHQHHKSSYIPTT